MSTALAPLGVPLIAPALPVVRDTFFLTDAQTSLLVSGYFVVGIVLSPFIGVLTDRFGRKRMLVTGLLTFGLLGGAMAFTTRFDVILALRVLQGTGAAAIFITTVTIIGDTFEGPQRNTVLGLNVAVLSAAAAIFPVLGGILVTMAWNAPFFAYFAAIPVAIFAYVGLEEPNREPSEAGLAYLRDAAGAIGTPGTLGLFAITFITEFLAFGVVFTAVPFVLADRVSPVFIGLAILVAEAVSTLVAAGSGRFARYLANEQLIGLGMVAYAVGFIGTWVGEALVVVTAALAIVGAGIGLLLPSIDATLSGRISREFRAGAFSLRNTTTFLGRASGPVVFTGLAVTAGYGYERLLLAAGVVAATAAVVVLLVDRLSLHRG